MRLPGVGGVGQNSAPTDPAPYDAVTGFDGRKQRNALTAAERALRSLAGGDGSRARSTAAKAAALDQIGAYAGLEEAVAAAAAELDSGGSVPASAWDRIAAVLGPGPLGFLVAELRAE